MSLVGGFLGPEPIVDPSFRTAQQSALRQRNRNECFTQLTSHDSKRILDHNCPAFQYLARRVRILQII